ncbi:E3 ubiquitin-protein ligase SIRP1-like [Hibiscus syriacus]|uniref:E3 ubiquitin-protein ligase SIRP1-like n=1 Tax=Hibiscus syriacus TaxID=106335 RepID=UPI00192072FE|nr:E3 ubiquitin-protein ligase SIRP1-like [Hibiscus syriacus]
MSLSHHRHDADFGRRICWESGPENGPWITLSFIEPPDQQPSNAGTEELTAEPATSAIEALRTVNITENHVANTTHCPVCRDEFEVGGEAIKLPCTHLYHSDCIMSCLNIKTTCRFKINGDSNNTAGNDAYETSEMNHRDIGLGVEDLANGLTWLQTWLLYSRHLRIFSHWTCSYLDSLDSMISGHNFSQEAMLSSLQLAPGGPLGSFYRFPIYQPPAFGTGFCKLFKLR